MFATTADVAALRAPAHAPVARRGTIATVAKESRIGKQPVKVPKGVTVKIEGQKVSAKVRSHAPALPPWRARRPRMPAPAVAFSACCAAFRVGPSHGCVPRRCPAAITARDRGIRPLWRALPRVSATAPDALSFLACPQGPKGELSASFADCLSIEQVRAQQPAPRARARKCSLTRWAARLRFGC